MNHKISLSVALVAVAAASFGQDVQLKTMHVPSVLTKSALVGAANPSQVIHITVSLPLGDPVGMQQFVDSVSDPTNPNFRQYLTPAQVGQQFGLSTDKVNAVVNYLKAEGFNVTFIGLNHLGIMATGTVAQAQAAFGTKINNYRLTDTSIYGRTNYYSFATPVQVPASIAPYVLDVSGLQNFVLAKPSQTALTPQLSRALYGLGAIYASGLHGEGRNIAISNWDGYRLNDAKSFIAKFGLPLPNGGAGANIHIIPINGSNGQNVAAQGEGDLDIQMAIGQSPLCNLYVYDDGGDSDFIGVLTRESNDNIADIISMSYGWNPDFFSDIATHDLFLTMEAQGITYMASSGDFGTRLDMSLPYPDYEPECLIVGGTSANCTANGTRISETGWSDGGGGWWPSGSSFNVKPPYQKGQGVLSVNKRLVPDVAGAADFMCYFYYTGGAEHLDAGGTSFATPIFAGQLGLAEQNAIKLGEIPLQNGKQRVGRLQDLLYRQLGNPKAFFDVTQGSNGILPDGTVSQAGIGWDTNTGCGAINWAGFNLQKFIALPLTPTLVSVPEGGGLDGWSWVLNPDGQYFMMGTSHISAGQAASAAFKFTLPTTVARAWTQELDFTVIARFATGSTGQIYMFNYITGNWDILKSFALGTTPVTMTTALKSNFNTYMSAAGEYRVLVRGLMPSVIGSTGNSVDIDYLASTDIYSPSTN